MIVQSGLKSLIYSYMLLSIIYLYLTFGTCLRYSFATGTRNLCYWLGIFLILSTIFGIAFSEGFVIAGGNSAADQSRVAAIGDLGKTTSPSGFQDVDS